MKQVLVATILAAFLAITGGYSTPASANSPLFGNAKVATLSNDEAKNVTAKGGTTAYYLYYGALYSSNAIYYAGLAQYYNYYNLNGSGGGATNYSYYAYYYSYYATSNYYNAYVSSFNGH